MWPEPPANEHAHSAVSIDSGRSHNCQVVHLQGTTCGKDLDPGLTNRLDGNRYILPASGGDFIIPQFEVEDTRRTSPVERPLQGRVVEVGL